jgi:hypothetical protein
MGKVPHLTTGPGSRIAVANVRSGAVAGWQCSCSGDRHAPRTSDCRMRRRRGLAASQEGIMSTLKGLLFGVLVLSASASTAPPAPVPPRIIPTGQVLEELAATQNFDRSVAEYVTLHRLLEMGVPPLRVTTDVREIQRAIRALALRIQVARVPFGKWV